MLNLKYQNNFLKNMIILLSYFFIVKYRCFLKINDLQMKKEEMKKDLYNKKLTINI